MRFSSLRTCNFRNLISSEIKLNGKDVFLVGQNGQGKSNFLEAIYFCSYASSFRGVGDKELIRTGNNECSVQALIHDSLLENLPLNNNNVVYDTILIKIQNDKKSILLNEKNIKERKDLLSIVPSIVFCHEDMCFINGSPEQRRWFFDQNLCLGNINYIDDLRKYKKILKTRNILLKEIKEKKQDSNTLLDVLDPQLAEYGLRLMQKRSEEMQFFSRVFRPLYTKVSGIDNIDIKYIASWKDKDINEIMIHLAKTREREIFLGLTLSGPHRDNYYFTRDGVDFSKKASTGQKRLVVLLLRASQASRFYEMNNKKPVLLLDDVLLELDGEKRIKFLSVLPEYEQAFYTFLPEEAFKKYKKDDTLIYNIDNGTLRDMP
jgi:DNA replication and repair protein RecF